MTRALVQRRQFKRLRFGLFKMMLSALPLPYTTLRLPLHLRQNPPACASSPQVLSSPRH
ncbi:hypothetical protein EMIT0P265_20095 [Pseudomonas zeae]